LTDDRRSILDAALVEKIKEIKLRKGVISIGELANFGDGSLTLACCLDTELVSIEQHDDGYKLVIDLGAQVLLFDYSKMRVVSSYPVMVELIDYLPAKPDESIITDRIRDLLLTNKYGINLFDDFVDTLETVDIKRSHGSAMQVADVIVEQNASSQLPPLFRDNPRNFKILIAQSFGKFLSKNQGVSILPYTKGSDIGNKMAMRFSDATVFELAIPEAQFAIELTVRGFKKVCAEEKPSGSCWVYGVYENIKIYQPALGKVYMDEKVRHAITKIVPSTIETFEDWPCYQNGLMALFNEITQDFSADRKYKKVRKVIKKCI
jgi:hypothetical protein